LDISFTDILIDLVKTASVVIVFAYLITRTSFFSDLLEKKRGIKSRIILILAFGALSIFGTYGGLKLPSGAIANIRDLGPVVAGLVGGPVVGLGAGIIGGAHRYFLGGFTALPCTLATIIAGLLGGIIYTLRKGKFPPVWQVMVISGSMELLHMGLTLSIARPLSEAWSVVKSLTPQMVAANAIGSGIFAYIINNLIKEQDTAAEKEKYRSALERKKFEIETARNIQESFLPESAPVIPGYDIAAFSVPALEVGGDFYDFIPISQDKWGFVIADVSGKGFPAALFMALSRMCVRANAMGKGTASEAIYTANTLISHDAASGMFVTLFYAVLDVKDNRLHYVNAGHNPPMLFKGNSGGVTLLSAKGIALGVMDDINLQEVEINLSPNDTLIFYTDGITEAIDSKEEQFGQKRLTQLIAANSHLSAQELANKIKDTVVDFTQGGAQFDDLTLVVLKTVRE
jgi:phosphoserine phosphatase RsbU/P